jgi:hypothetical protein
MRMAASIFLDFSLPNATTWFYLSLLLAVALFFKFSRFFSVRNWDVLTLFLLVPGLLLRQEAQAPPEAAEPDVTSAHAPSAEAGVTPAQAQRLLWLSYLWLLCGSGYLLARCLVDLALVRRPALTPNLNLGGLAWLAGAIFICLVAVAVRRPAPHAEIDGKSTLPAAEKVQHTLVEVVKAEAGADAGPDTGFWVERSLAMLCHLSVVALLVLIGWRHFQDVHAGMAMGTCYLLLPYTALQVAGWHDTTLHVAQWQYVWPMALLLGAVLAYKRPTVAGLFLGLAAGSAYFPVVVFPVWLGFYWRAGAGRFAGAFLLAAGLSLGIIGLILWVDGELARSLHTALDLSDWQPWKVPSAEGIWTGVHWAYRIPVFIAYAAFVLTTIFWPAPKNLAHLLALSAAALIGIQFWFADKGGVYVLWYLPLLLLLVFRPNLADRLPPTIATETDWLMRLGRRLGQRLNRLVKLPQPMAHVR